MLSKECSGMSTCWTSRSIGAVPLPLSKEGRERVSKNTHCHEFAVRHTHTDHIQRRIFTLTLRDVGGLGSVTANQDRYKVPSSELSQRREFVRGVRGKIKAIRDDITGGYGAGGRQRREDLMGTKKEQAEREKAKAQVGRENQDFLDGESMKQSLIIRQQDEALDDLHLSVTRIGEMGLNIHTGGGRVGFACMPTNTPPPSPHTAVLNEADANTPDGYTQTFTC